MYVKERSADSSWETWLAFLVTKSSYMASHLGGRARVLRRLARGGDHLVFVCASAGVDMTGRCLDQVMKNGEGLEVSSREMVGRGVVSQPWHRSIALEVEERLIEDDVVSCRAR